MVQNDVTPQTFQQLQEGIPIKIKEGETYIARPTDIEIIKDPLKLYPFTADRREIYPHTWLLITLTEGKYRQVRKMVLAARHRCLRLVRLSISGIALGSMPPGVVKEMDANTFYTLLGIVLPD